MYDFCYPADPFFIQGAVYSSKMTDLHAFFYKKVVYKKVVLEWPKP